MAIGLARMMGYNFPANFDHPYGASSITEFWHKWHISLSTWLRNYLYFPLGGNRHGKLRQYRNLFITMFLGGLWHGASWNFVMWGGLHGLALAVHKFWATRRGEAKSPPSVLWLVPASWLLTQLFVLLCWVPFRLPHFTQTLEVYSAFVGARFDKGLQHAPVNYWFLFLPLLLDTALGKFDFSSLRRFGLWFPQGRRSILLAFTLGLLFAVALSLMNMNIKPFIYFQF
jgi:D-alanyl-lipoteichoic acid acyltransferase DltB (MBOAT superfamily)